MKKKQEAGLVNVGSPLHQQLDAMPVEKHLAMARAAYKKTSTSSQTTRQPAAPAKAK